MSVTQQHHVPDPTVARPRQQLYLVRAVIAVVWAIGFAIIASDLDAPAITLLVLYPVIDVIASLYDARVRRDDPQAPLLYVNAAVSAVATAAVAVAAAGTSSDVLRVFGVWAIVSGILQLVVAVRRRALLGWQWPMLVSGGISTLAGVGFVVSARGDDPTLSSLAGYAGLGAVFYLVGAVTLAFSARRRP